METPTPSVEYFYFNAMFPINDEKRIDLLTTAKNGMIPLMDLNPTDLGCLYLSDILSRLGKIKYEDKEYEEATKYYEQSTHYGEIMVKLCPSASRYCSFADLCFKANDPRASDLYLRAIELGSYRACFHYGWFLHNKKDFNSAIFYYDKAIEDKTISKCLPARITGNIGSIYHERFIKEHNQDDFKQAEIHYEKAIHMIEGHKDPTACILLPILHSGSINEFWIEHKRMTEKMFSGVIMI